MNPLIFVHIPEDIHSLILNQTEAQPRNHWGLQLFALLIIGDRCSLVETEAHTCSLFTPLSILKDSVVLLSRSSAYKMSESAAKSTNNLRTQGRVRHLYKTVAKDMLSAVDQSQ